MGKLRGMCDNFSLQMTVLCPWHPLMCISQHHQAVNSVLTVFLKTASGLIPLAKGSVPQARPHFMPVAHLHCYLCFWPTGYKLEVPWPPPWIQLMCWSSQHWKKHLHTGTSLWQRISWRIRMNSHVAYIRRVQKGPQHRSTHMQLGCATFPTRGYVHHPRESCSVMSDSLWPHGL